MSFLRHEEIYRSDGRLSQSWERQPVSSLPVLIGYDEFPAGYSLAGCPPAEPASASPTGNDSQQPMLPYNDSSANGNNPLNFVSQPGDLVELDTLDVRPLPGLVIKQFTARDGVSRWDVIQAHTRATAQTASQFLDTLPHRMPFPIRAVPVDGGSEFAAFVLPPRSPKLNGAVERANRTHTEEFYQVTPCSLAMKKFNRELRHWERIYNTVRPHQALGYLTPQQFLRQNSSQRKE